MSPFNCHTLEKMVIVNYTVHFANRCKSMLSPSPMKTQPEHPRTKELARLDAAEGLP